MKILLDTNLVLDVLLDREPFVAASSAIWAACDAGQLTGFVPASAVTDVFYIARRMTDVATARVAVGLCLASFVIAPVDRATLTDASMLLGRDFEDDVQIACAIRMDVAAIVTRNRDDFAHAPLPVLSPDELLAQI
jgi:predicted nucleic acid-binding protein